MLLHLPHILTPAEIAQARQSLRDDAPWLAGERSAGAQAASQKNNLQLSQQSASARALQALILNAIQRDAMFFSDRKSVV